ncbi:MAG: glucan biosynthesis protein [Flavobacteriaceae bacterium]
MRFGKTEPFSLDRLKGMAESLAGQPYRPTPIADAETLEKLGYDLHNQITYRAEYTLWHGSKASPVRFFHPGRYFKEPVRIAVVENGKAREIVFSSDYFDIPGNNPARKLRGAGFAGFRVMDGAEDRDWLAVLGASYFRTSGPFDQFGLSARGLAVDTAVQGPEEFPRFTRFWLERGEGDGLVIYALMESPRVCGAYRIASARKDGIVQDVEARLFLRGDIGRLGIAPLTSMFWYGENDRELAKDWRPEIHDSDGLEIWTGAGERIWRPLVNPPRVTVNAFADRNPRGFGLMQRDRSFENYQDDGVFYEKRASLWVEPLGEWGAGSVQLVEIPTDDEIHDNIGVFWVPAEAAAAGRRLDLKYRLYWQDENPFVAPLAARVVATRTGLGGVPGQPRPEGVTKFAVDLEGVSLDGLGRGSGVEAVVGASRGEVGNVAAYPVVGTRRWRAIFDVTATGPQPVDLRMYLKRGDSALSETWIYQLFPGRA